MELEVEYRLKDDTGAVVQSGMQVFDDAELTAGSVGAVVKVKYDKDIEQVDHVGTSPRDRK